VRRWLWLFVVAVVAASGCADSGVETVIFEPSGKISAEGRQAAVKYGRAIFVEHDCGKAARDELFGEEPDYCAKYAHDNLRLSRQRLTRDCQEEPGIVADCVDLRFVGTRTVDLRLWMMETADGWRVSAYELTAR
jgi:hypothetical protein